MTFPVAVSLFTVPKAFTGHSGRIQRNAIASWAHLGAEVILVGDETGMADAARDLGVKHHPTVARNERGVPLVNDAFRVGQALASHAWTGFVNADIVLMDDFADAVRALEKWHRRCLLSGRRWNLDIDEALRFEGGWSESLMQRLRMQGKPADEWWLDYFLFPRGLISEMPPFLIGRAGWDNWVVYDCRRRGVPVVDASTAVTALHQNHDYSHLQEREHGWRGQESAANLKLLGGAKHAYNLADATHLLVDGRVKRRYSIQPLRRRLGFHLGFRGPREQ